VVLALTRTAGRDAKCEIITTLGLLNPVVMNCNPKRENIFFMLHMKTNKMKF